MTASIHERLIHCFATVFPEIAAAQIPAATPDTVAQWDSSRHVTLTLVIEEEFGVSIPEEMSGELLSFAEFEGYLQSQAQPK